MSNAEQRTERVRRALEEIRAGKMVVLVDDEDRENEGDLTMAASLVTPEAINFMAKHGRGLICMTVTEERADQLELPLQGGRQSQRGGSPLLLDRYADGGLVHALTDIDRQGATPMRGDRLA